MSRPPAANPNENRGTALLLTVAAGLLLPVLLLGAWAWLVLGGAIEQFRADEVREAQTVARDIADNWHAALRAAAGQDGPGRLALQLDAAGRPVAPFQPWPQQHEAPAQPPQPFVLSMAQREESRGRHAESLRYFEHAGRQAVLASTAATLAMARSLARVGRPREARQLLADVKPGAGGGPLSDQLLVQLLVARIAAESGDTTPARQLAERVFQGRVALPAEAAAPVVEMLQAWVPDLETTQPEAFQAAAIAFVSLRARDRPPLTNITLGPAGSILVPTPGTQTVVVLAPGVVAAVRQQLLERHRKQHPRWDVVAVAGATQDALANTKLPPLPTTLGVIARARLTSTLLSNVASLLLTAAIVAFVIGNLLAIRLVRRERALSALRSNFVDMVSHELRTPLAALSLKAEMLASDEVPAAKKTSYVRSLHTEVQRLVDRTRSILDFARLQRGAPALAARPVPLRELFARCVRECRTALRASQHRLDVQAGRDLPELEVDPDIVATALRNLIENAAKYSPSESTITLAARAEGGSLQITVSDEGPGIPAAERETIFEPFRRGQDTESSGMPGTGLGLAIVDRAARAHRGRVVAENRPEGGARFQLVLPCRQQDRRRA